MCLINGFLSKKFAKSWGVVFFKSTLFLTVLFVSVTASAQSIKSVRINEIQVYNADGFKDDYGQAGAWIELYNKGYGKVNLAGCTLKVKGVEYQIPKGDPVTVMSARGYMVFYAGGTPNKGTFHTNFTLDDTDFIEFYDGDGKLIDRFEFNPADMLESVSYGWLEDLDGKEKLMQLPATTPGGDNNTEVKESRSEAFRKADPVGIVLTTINIVIVSIALTMLFFVFKYMGKFHTRAARRKTKELSNNQVGEAVVVKETKIITNDELAVIAIALHTYTQTLHDNDELTLTINRVSKVYSPWSSKIYGLRQVPNKK